MSLIIQLAVIIVKTFTAIILRQATERERKHWMKIIFKPFRLLIYWWGKIRTKRFRLAKSSKLLKQKARFCSAFFLPVTAVPILTSPFNLKQFTFTSFWNRTETKLRRERGREKERKKKETPENCFCFKATRRRRNLSQRYSRTQALRY